MKTLRKRSTTRFLVFILMVASGILLTSATSSGQDRTRLKAYYEKLPNDDKKISISLTTGRGKNMEGVKEARISLASEIEDSTIQLAEIFTDELGEAELFIESAYDFIINEEGFAVINLSYEGNDTLRASKRSIEFMDLVIGLQLKVVDSVKLLTVKCSSLDPKGNPMLVEELKMRIGVQRLYSVLYLDEVETDDGGVAEFEFPNNIPGDDSGMINVVVKVEDHDEFGTVTKTAQIDWGVPVDYTIASNGRSLFGDSAPIWMISSVALILIGAWGHFFWAVFSIFRMKKLG